MVTYLITSITQDCPHLGNRVFRFQSTETGKNALDCMELHCHRLVYDSEFYSHRGKQTKKFVLLVMQDHLSKILRLRTCQPLIELKQTQEYIFDHTLERQH